MLLKPGMRLRSQVCDTEVLIVQAPADLDGSLNCGSEQIVHVTTDVIRTHGPAAGWDAGNALGKRYVADEVVLEVLVTKPGRGTLAWGNQPLTTKEAKALPSSD